MFAHVSVLEKCSTFSLFIGFYYRWLFYGSHHTLQSHCGNFFPLYDLIILQLGRLCNIYEIPSTILQKNISFQHLLSKNILSNLLFLVNFIIHSSKGYEFSFMKFKTPSWFMSSALIDTSCSFCFFIFVTSQKFHFWHHKNT